MAQPMRVASSSRESGVYHSGKIIAVQGETVAISRLSYSSWTQCLLRGKRVQTKRLGLHVAARHFLGKSYEKFLFAMI
jgi:hypothetical protein